MVELMSEDIWSQGFLCEKFLTLGFFNGHRISQVF